MCYPESMRLLSRRGMLSGSSTVIPLGSKQIMKPLTARTLATDQGMRLVRLGDNSGYTKGPFTAFMAPYNKGSLLVDKDYAESFALDPEQFPAGSLISWRWPMAGMNDPVRGFLAVDFGNYYNTVPEIPIQSSKVNRITSLTCIHDLSISGTAKGFSVIINFFLTSTPNPNSIRFEIEVFLHTPKYAKIYIDRVPSIGTFRSASDLAWNVAKDPVAAHGPDILFYPTNQADLLVGTVDLKEMLFWLASCGVITGDEFFNGLAIGVEPQQLDGTLTINALSVHYAAQ